MSVLDDLRQNVIDGNAASVPGLVKQAMSEGTPPEKILNESLISGMAQVGQLFEAGEFFVPEMLIAARAMKAGLELLRPHLAAANVKAVGKVVLGTVQGDLHDIGKNLIGMMLEGAGFRVVDLGSNVAPEQFLAAAREHGAAFVALSALLTTTMPAMQATVAALRASDLHDLKLIVGGAPVTEAFARGIGADGYAPDASSAVALVRGLVA